MFDVYHGPPPRAWRRLLDWVAEIRDAHNSVTEDVSNRLAELQRDQAALSRTVAALERRVAALESARLTTDGTPS